MHKIDIYRDLGASLELKDGLKGGENVVISPPVDLAGRFEGEGRARERAIKGRPEQQRSEMKRGLL